MEFVGSFSMSRIGYDYLYVGEDRFNNMCILIPCKKHVTVEQTTYMFFANVWVHFGFPTSIIYIETLSFWESFGLSCGSQWTLS
jgi:hypothetical protein